MNTRHAEVKTIIGTVIECKLMDATSNERFKKDLYALSILDSTDIVHNMWVYGPMYIEFDLNMILFKDNVVVVTALDCIKDETHIITDDDEIIEHEVTHLELKNAYDAPTTTVIKLGLPMSFATYLADVRALHRTNTVKLSKSYHKVKTVENEEELSRSLVEKYAFTLVTGNAIATANIERRLNELGYYKDDQNRWAKK